jgi:type I restriction enzyme M protein
LLELKWIKPLVSSLNKLPEAAINELTTKVQALAEKYETTYSDIVEDINNTEIELASLIDELTGNEFDMKGLNEFKSLLNGE